MAEFITTLLAAREEFTRWRGKVLAHTRSCGKSAVSGPKIL